jgi:catechol 2,3-dioxygenase-like lactoylglutathione lyase family enzyme
MLDHVGLTVHNREKSVAFYRRALKPLGYRLTYEDKEYAGFGTEQGTDFWLKSGSSTTGPVHVAFRNAEREQVDRFYDAALSAGGKDNGPPGLRPHYHSNYYAAFVLDPDGNNIETVCHTS